MGMTGRMENRHPDLDRLVGNRMSSCVPGGGRLSRLKSYSPFRAVGLVSGPDRRHDCNHR